MYFCKAYINADLWGTFSKKLKKLRKAKEFSANDLVIQNENLINEMIGISREFESDRNALNEGKAPLPDTFIKFIKAQDR